MLIMDYALHATTLARLVQVQVSVQSAQLAIYSSEINAFPV